MKPMRKLWGLPFLLFVMIIAGLFAAIIGTGVWHLLSWTLLFVPLLILIIHAWKAFK